MMRAAILGNGQLGAMLEQAGKRIGVAIDLLDVDTGAVPAADIPISSEREHWPSNAFTVALQRHPTWLNSVAYQHLTDRRNQKALLDQLALPTAAWYVPTNETKTSVHERLGPDVFLKSATGGYDGRGQMRLRQTQPLAFPDWIEESIAESAVSFDAEVSLVAARSEDGQIVYYRLTENYHHRGILHISLSLENSYAHLQQRAENMMASIMQQLDYVGVMAIEFFVVGNDLLINEIAPRVHNSGHWTQAGASISQFELHVRAICGLPIVQPEQGNYSMMVNLIGLDYDNRWLTHSAAQLHWYGKSHRPGRKMGHLNFHHTSPDKLAVWLKKLDLPSDYDESRTWALTRLSR